MPNQDVISWPIAFSVSMAGIKRRFSRAMITMAGVVLAIAFLCYMMVNQALVASLISVQNPELNILLQKNGVNIYGSGEMDQMTIMLLCLTLITSLVGILNAMLMAVTERVKEIGTLKCLGATDQFIVRAYFIESTVQGMESSQSIGVLLQLPPTQSSTVQGSTDTQMPAASTRQRRLPALTVEVASWWART